MNRTIAKTVTVATLFAGAILAVQPASAMGFKNCTGDQIRVKIYNNNDVSTIIAKRNKTLGVNDYHWFKLDSRLYQVKLFRSRVGIDREMYLKGGLNGGHKFSIRKTRSGNYYVSSENDCTRVKPKPDPAPRPVATIDVNPGKWVGRLGQKGRWIERLRRQSDHSFTMKRRGEAPVLYTLVGRDTYQTGSGSRIYVQSNGRMLWISANGSARITYTRKS